ncbi:MAG: hypothetical protein M4579_001778 [Chaenotheca gracillima]|nr:MAG: hypothetical protein M4579_001778 [Chaenotheca gracillima]
MPRKGGGGAFAAEIQAAKLRSVTFPPKIVCRSCKKPKEKLFFSQRQLNDLAFKITRLGPSQANVPAILCRSCTGAQVTELRCTMCSEVKGNNEFSKAQRHDPDHARCLVCVKAHEATEPDNAPPSYIDVDDDFGAYFETDENDDNDSVSNRFESEADSQSNYFTQEDTNDEDDTDDEEPIRPSDLLTSNLTASNYAAPKNKGKRKAKAYHEPRTPVTATSSIGGVPLPENAKSNVKGKGKARAMDVSSVATATGPRTNTTVDRSIVNAASIATGEEGWITQPRRGARTIVSEATTGPGDIPYTAYDPQGVPHSRAKAPTVVSEAPYAGPAHMRSTYQGVGNRKESKWARVKARPVKVDVGIFADSEYTKAKSAVQYSSDEESEDEDGAIAEW